MTSNTIATTFSYKYRLWLCPLCVFAALRETSSLARSFYSLKPPRR